MNKLLTSAVLSGALLLGSAPSALAATHVTFTGSAGRTSTLDSAYTPNGCTTANSATTCSGSRATTYTNRYGRTYTVNGSHSTKTSGSTTTRTGNRTSSNTYGGHGTAGYTATTTVNPDGTISTSGSANASHTNRYGQTVTRTPSFTLTR